jgi:hypothetical protein
MAQWKMQALATQGVGYGLKLTQLVLAFGVLGLVGMGEMRKEPFEAQMAVGKEARHDGKGLCGGEAHAAHASVNLDVHGGLAALALRLGLYGLGGFGG